jgi:hypothetical protein
MTAQEWSKAAEIQRQHDLYEARRWRDHWQRQVDKLEARDPLNLVSTGSESKEPKE